MTHNTKGKSQFVVTNLKQIVFIMASDSLKRSRMSFGEKDNRRMINSGLIYFVTQPSNQMVY